MCVRKGWVLRVSVFLGVAWVVGGAGKQCVRLGSLVQLDLGKNRARELNVKGTRPAPRERHAACLLHGLEGQVMVVFGGRAAPTSPMGDLWVLTGGSSKPRWGHSHGIETKGQKRLTQDGMCVGSWELVEGASGEAPCARWGHSMTALGHNTVSTAQQSHTVDSNPLHLSVHTDKECDRG